MKIQKSWVISCLFLLVFLCAAISPASADTRLISTPVKFTASPLTGTSPLEVQFKNHTIAPFTIFNWCYGDGTQDIFEHSWQNKIHPSNIYDMPGSYSPLLQVLTQEYPTPNIFYIIPEYIYIDDSYSPLGLTAMPEGSPTYSKCGWDKVVDGDPFSWVTAKFNQADPVPATGTFAFSNGLTGTIHKIRLLPVGIKIGSTELIPRSDTSQPKMHDKAAQDDINIAQTDPLFFGSVETLTGKRYLTNLATQITIETSHDGENWTALHAGEIDLSPTPQQIVRQVIDEYTEQGGDLYDCDTPNKKQQNTIAPQYVIKEFESSTPLLQFSGSYGLWKTIELDTPVTAKYIRVGLSEPAGPHARYVELAEIQIFGEAATVAAESMAKNKTSHTDIKTNSFELAQNYPNPFNPSTEISFNLPEDAAVSVEIYNVRGEKVSQLINSNMAAGVHQLMWNARNASGMNLTSGTYYCRFTAKTATQQISQTRKMLYLR